MKRLVPFSQSAGKGNPGTGRDGTGRDGTGRDGRTGRDGTGRDGVKSRIEKFQNFLNFKITRFNQPG